MNERITTAGIVKKGNLYLVGCRHTEESLNNEKWEFIGGKNRYGESEEETLKREFLEELGVEVEVGNYLTSIDFENAGTLYHLKAYSVTLLSEDFHLLVHSRVEWLTLAELGKRNLVDSDRRLTDFLSQL